LQSCLHYFSQGRAKCNKFIKEKSVYSYDSASNLIGSKMANKPKGGQLTRGREEERKM
jgi:hypothetical protein